MSIVFTALRTAFDRTLTAFVIFLLAALAVLILVGVEIRQ